MSDPQDIDVTIPSPEGLKVTLENQPYRILMVGDFAGSEAGQLTGPMDDGVVAFGADSFAELMKTANPQLRLRTTDPIAAGGKLVEIDLSFDSLKSFSPANIIKQLPQTKPLSAIREAVVGRMTGKMSADALASATQQAVASDATLAWLIDSLSWTAKAPQDAADAVTDIMGQLDLGGDSSEESEPPTKSPVGKLVSSAAASGSSIPAEEASSLRRCLAEIDKRLSSWLTVVLHAPEVQAIEARWRSLAFLSSCIEFRKGIRLFVLHASTEQLTDRIDQHLIGPVFDEGADAPHLIVVDRQFTNSASDMDTMDELAQHAASLPAVLITDVGPAFFGVKHTWQIPTLPAITNMMDQWQFAKFKALRLEPYSRLLGVVFGRGLLRMPSGREGVGELEFAYKEPCVTERDLVWAGGAVSVACKVAHSVAETSWPMSIAGPAHGRLEGFKQCEGGKKGDKVFGPTNTMLAREKIEDMGMAGVNVVVGARDHADAVVWNAMSVARAPRDNIEAIVEVSLPYQFFVTRLSALLFTLKDHLLTLPGDQVAAVAEQHLRDWIPFEGESDADQCAVHVQPNEEDNRVIELAVTVTPPESLVPGGVPVVMGYRLG